MCFFASLCWSARLAQLFTQRMILLTSDLCRLLEFLCYLFCYFRWLKLHKYRAFEILVDWSPSQSDCLYISHSVEEGGQIFKRAVEGEGLGIDRALVYFSTQFLLQKWDWIIKPGRVLSQATWCLWSQEIHIARAKGSQVAVLYLGLKWLSPSDMHLFLADLHFWGIFNSFGNLNA